MIIKLNSMYLYLFVMYNKVYSFDGFFWIILNQYISYYFVDVKIILDLLINYCIILWFCYKNMFNDLL